MQSSLNKPSRYLEVCMCALEDVKPGAFYYQERSLYMASYNGCSQALKSYRSNRQLSPE